MGLVNELQESAERDDVLTTLRKAKRLSSKLGLKDISEWLDHEQNGYPRASGVPDYRNIIGQYCYNTNGYIPAGYGMVKSGIQIFNIGHTPTIPVGESISTVASWAANLERERHIYVELDQDIAEQLRSQFCSPFPEILERLTFLVRLDDTQIQAIPEHVKNKVLDWACDLEAAGVTGAGQSFSEQEKRIAETVNFHIINSSVEQINNAGINLKRGANG